jgi:hypothetical protein
MKFTDRNRRPVVATGIGLLLAAAATACGGGGTTAATHPSRAATSQPSRSAALPAGHVGSLAQVPWQNVGPGWALAEYTTGDEKTAAPVTLYLIDPAGGMYRIYKWPATTQPWRLLGWSGDTTRALFGDQIGADRTQATFHELTLRSGELTTFTLPLNTATVGYTRPDGLNILAWVDQRETRYSRTGVLQAVLVSGGDFDAISSPDGLTAVVSGGYGVTLASNAGGIIRQLPIPGADPNLGECEPMRWWNSATVLVSCKTSRVGQRVWLVPLSGAPPQALTPVRDGTGPDLGDIDAFQLPSGLYVDALGSSGSFIGKQDASGNVTMVSDASQGATLVVATAGGRMLLREFGTGDTAIDPPCSLAWFDPSTGALQTVLSEPANGVGVLHVVPYNRDGEQPAWT